MLSVTAALLSAGGAVAAERAHGSRVVTYTVRTDRAYDSETNVFAAMASVTLNDRRGWTARGTRFKRVAHGGDFDLRLATPRTVAAAHPTCDRAYSCRVRDDIRINGRRWTTGATTYRRESLYSYRQYVINHEVGHWLGFGHAPCPRTGTPAPVMSQQTIRLDGCTPRVWPLAEELARLPAGLGAPPRPRPPVIIPRRESAPTAVTQCFHELLDAYPCHRRMTLRRGSVLPEDR